MKNNNASLNSQLDAPNCSTLKRGVCIFNSRIELDVISYDPESNLGLARSFRTDYTVAFSLDGESKPVARRQWQAEQKVSVYEIDTVVNAAGNGIEGALGAKRGGQWKVPDAFIVG